MSDNNTPTNDRIEQLEARVEELEGRLEQRTITPTRRQAVKAGGGLAALLGLGATAGTGAAAPGDDGDTVWGSDTNRDDYYADEIDAKSVDTEQLGTGRHYAGAYSGSDHEARLTNCLNAASAGEIIYLEPAQYDSQRTVGTNLGFVGTGIVNGAASIWDWTFNSTVSLSNVEIGNTSNAVVIAANSSTVSNVRMRWENSQIVVQANECSITGVSAGVSGSEILLESGTVGNSTAGIASGANITDNGSNPDATH